MYQIEKDLAGENRIATEYGALCLYLCLMSHTTGTLQQLLGELLQDEVHLTKFWGMGMWLNLDGAEHSIRYFISEIHTILPVSYELKRRSRINTLKFMMLVSSWQFRSLLSKKELVYTFIWILKRMWFWSGQLTSEYLHLCCASPSFFEYKGIAFIDLK